MSRDFLDELSHSWGNTPKQKAREKEYNAEYYRRNKERWQQYQKKAIYESAKRVDQARENLLNDYVYESARAYSDKYDELDKNYNSLKTANDILYTNISRKAAEYKKMMAAYKKMMSIYERDKDGNERQSAKAQKAREGALNCLKEAGAIKREAKPMVDKYNDGVQKMKNVSAKQRNLLSSYKKAGNMQLADKNTRDRLTKLLDKYNNAIKEHNSLSYQYMFGG